MANSSENIIALNEEKQNLKNGFIALGVDMENVPFTRYHEKFAEIKISEAQKPTAELITGTYESETMAGVILTLNSDYTGSFKQGDLEYIGTYTIGQVEETNFTDYTIAFTFTIEEGVEIPFIFTYQSDNGSLKLLAEGSPIFKRVVVQGENLDPELTAQETKLAKLEEDVNALSDKDDTALKILDGTLEEFDNTKIGATSLSKYRFNEFSQLKSANFMGITNIPINTCYNCTNLSSLVIDPNTTNIGDYAFYYCGVKNTILTTNKTCNIGNSAFYYCTLDGIDVKLGNVKDSAFCNINNMKSIKMSINGSVGTNAFDGAYNVEQFNFDKNSVITSLSTKSFARIGSSRPNPENNIFTFDFRNSKFTTIPDTCFGYSNSTYGNRYYDIKFPTSVTTINSYAFRYSDHMTLYFTRLTPASLNANAFSNATNLKICVPYNSVNAYKTATNWSAQASNIRGFADINTFKQGQELPQYSSEGYALTWYSDIDLTTPVTTATNIDQYYYCTISGEAIDVVEITMSFAEDCEISVVDNSTGHEYFTNEGIPVGTEVTITVTPTIEGYVPYIQSLNDEDFTSPLIYTPISGTNINLVCTYYNGVDVPLNPDFNQNSWAVIKRIIQDGKAGQYWSVGDVKEIKIGSLTYGVRLSDLKEGRYNYANGTRTTNAVLEFVELYSTYYSVNSTNTNAGGWATSALYTTINTTIFNKLPMELRSLIDEVVVKSANGGGTNYTEITESNNKLFIPCVEEVGCSTSNYGRVGEGTIWDYYRSDSSVKRRKSKVDGTKYTWWLRSPDPKNTTMFHYINQNTGECGSYGTNGAFGICPCFAW